MGVYVSDENGQLKKYSGLQSTSNKANINADNLSEQNIAEWNGKLRTMEFCAKATGSMPSFSNIDLDSYDYMFIYDLRYGDAENMMLSFSNMGVFTTLSGLDSMELNYNGAYLGWGKLITGIAIMSKPTDTTRTAAVTVITGVSGMYAYTTDPITDTVIFHRTAGTLNPVSYATVFMYRSKK